MSGSVRSHQPPPEDLDPGTQHRFEEALHSLHRATDRFFAKLMIVQWIAAIAMAWWLSPRTWTGPSAGIHPHVHAAVVFGALITLLPVWYGFRYSGHVITRHTMAAAQTLMSALLIHVTGGRIETHFHVFGSLAFLAFYRDIRVLVTATVIVAVDHMLRGIFWPQSVYGVFVASLWRTAEHAFWVIFEVSFLSVSIRRSLAEMKQVARRQFTLEGLNQEMAGQVEDSAKQLQESEKRYRALFNEAPIGLFQSSPQGELLMANEVLLQLLGFNSAEEMRTAGFRLRGAISDQEITSLLFQIGDSQLVCNREVHWRRRDGSKVHVQERIRAARNAAGKIAHFEGSVEDVSEWRELQNRFLQSQKVQAIGQLAGGVAHDFNNILTAIIGYSDLLIEQGSLARPARAQVDEIKRASERAASLTQQLLAFSRKQTLLPRVIQLNAVIAEMGKMLRRLVGEHIEIHTKLASDLAAVKVDPGQVQQVVMNLVVNARDAMPNGGKLIVESANARLDDDYCRMHSEVVPGDYVMLAVSDSGVGMTAEVKARIFEPFFTTKAAGQGTGLGLSTCHGIIKQSGGSISVYSEPGVGSTFRIYFPVSHEPIETQPVRERSARITRGDETILLVEDEPMVRELGVLALSSLGYRVIEASNGVEALNRLQKLGTSAIGLIVTDVVMPEMGGRELAKRARELEPSMRILFSSGYTSDAIEHSQLLEEGTYFLPKPYTMTMLADKIREVLDEPDLAAADAETLT
jgi:PAS domain S-box-containing protein